MMAVVDFNDFITKARARFRCILGYHDAIISPRNSLKSRYNLKMVLKEMLDECCSEFEEETLKENLKEEFQDYLNSLKEKEGE